MARAVYAEGTQFSEFGEEKDGVVKEGSLSSRLLCGLKNKPGYEVDRCHGQLWCKDPVLIHCWLYLTLNFVICRYKYFTGRGSTFFSSLFQFLKEKS